MFDWAILFTVILLVLCLALIACIYRLKITLRQFYSLQNQQRNLHAITADLSHIWKQPLNHLGFMLMRINQVADHDERISNAILDITEEADDTLQFLAETLNTFNSSIVDNQAAEIFTPAQVITGAILLLRDNFKRSKIEINADLNPHLSLHNHRVELLHVLISILLVMRDAFISHETTNPLITIALIQSNSLISLSIESNVDIHSSNPSSQSVIALTEAKRLIEQVLAGSIVIRNKEFKTLVGISLDNCT